MDFNDLNLRIKRLYSSINATIEEANTANVKVTKTVSPVFKGFHISFDNTTDRAQDINKIINIISNLANLKDHIKIKMKNIGLDDNLTEKEIDRNQSLQIVIDLNNSEKHGYPLTHKTRSGLNPRLVNIGRSLRASLTPNVMTSISVDVRSGELITTGDTKIIIDADVIDQNENIICRFLELANKCCLAWEDIIRRYNLN